MQPIDNELIDQLAQAIANYTAPVVPLHKELWTAEKCAAYFGMKTRYFYSHLACLPSFPKRIKLPIKGGVRSQARWIAQDIIDYAIKHKETN